MFQTLLQAVSAEASGERALETVRELTRLHRVQASPGYDQAADWLCARLESYGLEAERVSVPGDGRTRCLGQLMPEGWECTRAVASLVQDGFRVLEFRQQRADLEEVFMNITKGEVQ